MAATRCITMTVPPSTPSAWPPAPPQVTAFTGVPELGLPLFDVLEGLGLGVWDWNLATRRAYVSPSGSCGAGTHVEPPRAEATS